MYVAFQVILSCVIKILFVLIPLCSYYSFFSTRHLMYVASRNVSCIIKGQFFNIKYLCLFKGLSDCKDLFRLLLFLLTVLYV